MVHKYRVPITHLEMGPGGFHFVATLDNTAGRGGCISLFDNQISFFLARFYL